MPGFLAEHLHRPENRQYHAHLKAAEKYGVPPTIFLHGDKTDPNVWSLEDKRLAIAWQVYQDELCKRCGVPVWLGHSENAYIDFKIEKTTCYSCQAIESNKDEDDPGEVKYATPCPVEIEGEDVQLPSRAEAMKSMQ